MLIFTNPALYCQPADSTAKHSAIVEADGYVFLSEDKTIRQLREEALAAAKRAALEQGETFIQSFTWVENFQMKYDLVQTEAEGSVKILASKDYGIIADNRYRYWIKAEIQYRPRQPAEQRLAQPFYLCAAVAQFLLHLGTLSDRLLGLLLHDCPLLLQRRQSCFALRQVTLQLLTPGAELSHLR